MNFTGKMKRGDRVGLISGLRFSEPKAYPIRSDHDSNKFCLPTKGESIP